MSNKMYNQIIPFNEFWIDCYSTAIFSILQSFYNADKSVYYNNNYQYECSQNVRTYMWRTYITLNLDNIINSIFTNKELHDFTKDEDIVSELKQYIDKKRIIFLGIDMYYGIPDTSQWKKHHIHHNILVEGYDEEFFYVLETGDHGYKEYTMTYEEITKAAKEFTCFTRDTEIFELKNEGSKLAIDNDEYIKNAKVIILSIDELCAKIDDLWHIAPEKILSMRDEIDSHLKAIRNRQEVNASFLGYIQKDKEYENLINSFLKLRDDYQALLDDINEICVSGQYYEKEKQVKKVFSELLITEKNLWGEFIRIN